VYAVRVTVDDGESSLDSSTFDVTVNANTFRVIEFMPNVSGFDVTFSKPADVGVLNLYDGADATADVPDVALQGDSGVGEVRGSLIWDSATNTASFVKTGGVLQPATYTATLRSAVDAWQDTSGELLDGEPDYVPGGDYMATFEVHPSGHRVVSLPDFTRGATLFGGQVVDVPASGSGLPIHIDEAAGVHALDLDLVYDPDLLHIPFDPDNQVFGAKLVPGMPGSWSVASNLVAPGFLKLTIFGPTALPAGGRDLIVVDAKVPAGAPYGETQVIRIENLRVNGGLLEGEADRAVHKVAFFGDADGGGFLSGADAGLITRTVVLLDGPYSGFDSYQLTDPVIVANVTGTGTFSGLDASWVAQKSLAPGIRPEIPDVPFGPAPASAGPDLELSMPDGVLAKPGQAVSIPVDVADATGLFGFNASVEFDTALLDLTAGPNDGFDSPDVVLGDLFALAEGWSLLNCVDDVGRIGMSFYRTTPMAGGNGTIAQITFAVKALATTGTTVLDVDGPQFDQGLEFTHVDGSIAITSAEVVGRHLFYKGSTWDDEIAPNKKPLMPGGVAAFENYTSYDRGINGMVIDIAGLPNGVAPTTADFEFRVGNDRTPGDWKPVALDPTITMQPGLGANNSDRLTFGWPDGTIRNTWLQVTVKDDNLWLPAEDVFYFGNAVAEAGDSDNARVGVADLLLARNNPRDFLHRADITSPYDYNRDSFINATDVLLARNNQTGFLDELILIDLTGAAEAAQSAPLANLAWLSDLDQPATQRSAQKDGAAEAVDLLLATLWT